MVYHVASYASLSRKHDIDKNLFLVARKQIKIVHVSLVGVIFKHVTWVANHFFFLKKKLHIAKNNFKNFITGFNTVQSGTNSIKF